MKAKYRGSPSRNTSWRPIRLDTSDASINKNARWQKHYSDETISYDDSLLEGEITRDTSVITYDDKKGCKTAESAQVSQNPETEEIEQIVQSSQAAKAALVTEENQQWHENEGLDKGSEKSYFSGYNGYRCKKCNEEIPSLSFFAIHVQRHTQESHFFCPECQCILYSLNDLSDHCYMHKIGCLECPVCCSSHPDPRLFRLHLDLHAIDSASDDSESHYSSADEADTEVSKISLYRAIYRLCEEVSRHRKNVRDTWLCPSCSAIFHTRFRYSLHRQFHRHMDKIAYLNR